MMDFPPFAAVQRAIRFGAENRDRPGGVLYWLRAYLPVADAHLYKLGYSTVERSMSKPPARAIREWSMLADPKNWTGLVRRFFDHTRKQRMQARARPGNFMVVALVWINNEAVERRFHSEMAEYSVKDLREPNGPKGLTEYYPISRGHYDMFRSYLIRLGRVEFIPEYEVRTDNSEVYAAAVLDQKPLTTRRYSDAPDRRLLSDSEDPDTLDREFIDDGSDDDGSDDDGSDDDYVPSGDDGSGADNVPSGDDGSGADNVPSGEDLDALICKFGRLSISKFAAAEDRDSEW